MSNIEMVTLKGYCMRDCEEYDMQCHTCCAEYKGCIWFDDGETIVNVIDDKTIENVIPFGDCKYADFKYGYTGISVKKYDMEELIDNYNPHLNCMVVRAGNKEYFCEKVTLNGEVIYNNREDDNGDNV